MIDLNKVDIVTIIVMVKEITVVGTNKEEIAMVVTTVGDINKDGQMVKGIIEVVSAIIMQVADVIMVVSNVVRTLLKGLDHKNKLSRY
jgi:hypothetical protein